MYNRCLGIGFLLEVDIKIYKSRLALRRNLAALQKRWFLCT